MEEIIRRDPIYPSPNFSPWKHPAQLQYIAQCGNLFSIFHEFVASRMFYKQNHTVGHLLRLASLHNSPQDPSNLYISIINSFLLLSLISWYRCTIVYSPFEGHLDCFQFGASINYAAMNKHVQVFV